MKYEDNHLTSVTLAIRDTDNRGLKILPQLMIKIDDSNWYPVYEIQEYILEAQKRYLKPEPSKVNYCGTSYL